jgi:hypothetical protein
MIAQNEIEQAKEISIYDVLEHFNWEIDYQRQTTLCPNERHDDTHPGVPISQQRNICRCFVCNESFDTIDVYRKLSYKVNREMCSFPQAIMELLSMEGVHIPQSNEIYIPNGGKGGNGDLYEKILSNCKPIQGYELNYLHQRGIFLYDSYVFGNKVYTNSQLANETNATLLSEIKTKGKLYRGIANTLMENKVKVLHNFYGGVNSIVYLINYEEHQVTQNDFLRDSERHMMVMKSLDAQHQKKSIGESTWVWLCDECCYGGDIYICEGMEDALSLVQNGLNAISLNSIANIGEMVDDLRCIRDKRKFRFILSLDHDAGGEEATNEAIELFEKYNAAPRSIMRKFRYDVCRYPQEFHDINDYWISKVYGNPLSN